MVFIYFKLVNDNWSYKELPRAFLYFIIPTLIFYLPLFVYTWVESGSPFGSFLNSFFTGKEQIFDPYYEFKEGNLGYRGSFKEIIFFLLTKWSPLIWISWIFIPLGKINLRTKLTLAFIILAQFFLIWALLPNRPRHFGGFQYVPLIIIFVEIIPIFYSNFRNYLICLFFLATTPWIFLDLYYALPLVTKAFHNPEQFKEDYIPFFYDFKKIDKILEKNAQLIVFGTRLNYFHAPRKFYENKIDIKDKKLPTYLFIVGNKESFNFRDINLRYKIYENFNAKRFCYRTPNKKCDIEKLSVYKINFIN